MTIKFHIPFTYSHIDELKKKSEFVLPYIKPIKESRIGEDLKNAGIEITREEYISICLRTFMFIFFISLVVATTILLFFITWYKALAIGFIIAFVFSIFIFSSQFFYPGMYVQKRERNIEKNLIAGLQDIVVQLTSGIPLFTVLVNISSVDYGELSVEFKKAVKRINAGTPEQKVLEDLSKRNPSVLFRRVLWQISNGMNAGSDMTLIIKDNIKALHEEQTIQIQNYGNSLNPLIVFYMLVAIIIPSLAVTFLTLIASLVNLGSNMAYMGFIGLFVFVVLMQILFLGVIKSRRPSLL
jgi:archaeal flagellar protein FlaJ